jgi:hypothetical protein
MDTILVLLVIIGIMFLFDCAVIIYLVTVMATMKKDGENKNEETE